VQDVAFKHFLMSQPLQFGRCTSDALDAGMIVI